jgi:hypothetical protein
VRARHLAVALLAVALPVGAAGCSNDDGGDSKATTELIAELRADGMPKKQAECIARAFDEAELSPDEVAAVREEEAIDDIDPDALETYARSASECLGVTVETPGG